MVVDGWKLGRMYRTNWIFTPGPVVCDSITLSTRPQLFPPVTGASEWYERFHSMGNVQSNKVKMPKRPGPTCTIYLKVLLSLEFQQRFIMIK